MRWIMVWVNLLAHPKFISLSMEARGAWLTLLLYASSMEPERWRFRSRDHAALLLKHHGANDPAGSVATLIEAGLLNELAGGGLEIHDHADWQRYLSDTPEGRAERQRRSRANREKPGHKLVTRRHDPVTTVEESKEAEIETEEKHSSHSNATSNVDRGARSNPSIATFDNVKRFIESKWGFRLSAKQSEVVREIADRQGEGSKGYARVLGLLTVTEHPDPMRLLMDTDSQLKEEGRRRADAQEAESARWKQGGSLREQLAAPQHVGDVIRVVRPDYGGT
jgi:hypothetical protein